MKTLQQIKTAMAKCSTDELFELNGFIKHQVALNGRETRSKLKTGTICKCSKRPGRYFMVTKINPKYVVCEEVDAKGKPTGFVPGLKYNIMPSILEPIKK